MSNGSYQHNYIHVPPRAFSLLKVKHISSVCPLHILFRRARAGRYMHYSGFMPLLPLMTLTQVNLLNSVSKLNISISLQSQANKV